MEQRLKLTDLMQVLAYLYNGLGDGVDDLTIQVWADQFNTWPRDRLWAAARHLKRTGWHRTFPQVPDMFRADSEARSEAARKQADVDAERRRQEFSGWGYERPRDKPGLLEMFYELRASQKHAQGKHGEGDQFEKLAAAERERRLSGGVVNDDLGALVGAVGRKF